MRDDASQLTVTSRVFSPRLGVDVTIRTWWASGRLMTSTFCETDAAYRRTPRERAADARVLDLLAQR
jgi:hypothetical protein